MVITSVIGVLRRLCPHPPSIVVTLGMLSILKGGLDLGRPAAPWITQPCRRPSIAQFRLFGRALAGLVHDHPHRALAAILPCAAPPSARSIYAVGRQFEAAARVAGISVRAGRRSAIFAHPWRSSPATAAILFAHAASRSSSRPLPPNLELTVITASVVGGVSILGGTGTVVSSTPAAILFAAIGSLADLRSMSRPIGCVPCRVS